MIVVQNHEFRLPVDDEVVLELPSQAEVLGVGSHDDRIILWVRVDTEEKSTLARRFSAIGTGHSGASGKYLGTTLLATVGLHVHVFEVTDEAP